jgi:hypothetical protein
MALSITAFWTTFWLLNGLDKFFNGDVWFGVTRDPRMMVYFDRLHMPQVLAYPTLYGVAVWELGLGVAFGWSLVSRERRESLLPMAFHGAMGLFTFFAACDILLGERGELMEHAVYMLLVVLTFAYAVPDRLTLGAAVSYAGLEPRDTQRRRRLAS